MKYVFFGCNEKTIQNLLEHLGHLEHVVYEDTLSFINVSDKNLKLIESKAEHCCPTCQTLGSGCRIRMKLPN